MRNKEAYFSELESNFLQNLHHYNDAILEIDYLRTPVTEIEVMTLQFGFYQ